MQCCDPSPIVAPSAKAEKYSRVLRIIFYCELVLVILLFTALLMTSALFELINLFLLYLAYKSYNFCTLIIFMFLVMFNLISAFVLLGNLIQNYDYIGDDILSDPYNIYAYTIVGISFIFYLVAIIYAFFAYREFKALLLEQTGGAGAGK